MDYLSMMGMALLAAGMVMLLRQMYPAAAALMTIAFGAMALSVLLPDLRAYAGAVSEFLSAASLDAAYGAVMIKAMGVVLLTELASEACREFGAAGIGRYAELCGRIVLLGIALPVFLSLTQMAVDVLQ